jgi:vesicle-associated membrane protein 72
LVQADSFHVHGRELDRAKEMRLQNLRFKLMVGGAIAVVLILMLWLMICRAFKC